MSYCCTEHFHNCASSLSQQKQQENTFSITFYHTYFTSHSVDMKTHFGRTPLNSLSLITISLEWVHELSSFLLKRILKYTIIKMHSASFFINGSNGAYKVARCVAYYISVEETNKQPYKHSTRSWEYGALLEIQCFRVWTCLNVYRTFRFFIWHMQ